MTHPSFERLENDSSNLERLEKDASNLERLEDQAASLRFFAVDLDMNDYRHGSSRFFLTVDA